MYISQLPTLAKVLIKKMQILEMRYVRKINNRSKKGMEHRELLKIRPCKYLEC